MTIRPDKYYMRRALALAVQGLGWVAPNPLVGAVLVKKGKIIGQGYHARYGEIHAEVAALKDAAARGADVTGATLYVTLEPCNHTGQQPPCTTAILKAKIARVVYAAPDPNPDVKGGGAPKLRAAGLTIDAGILEAEARYQNKIFFHWVATRQPYVLVKVAVSSNNKLTSRRGTPTAISGPAAWEFTQSLRQLCDAIMVGANTVIIDNPSLTVRSKKIPRPRSPLRVIIDGRLTVPLTAKIFQDNHNLIITSSVASAAKIRAFKAKAAVAVSAGNAASIKPKKILAELAGRGVTSVLIEGGAHLLQLFFESGLVNEWIIVRARKKFTGGVNFIKEPERFTKKFLLERTVAAGADTIEHYSPL